MKLSIVSTLYCSSSHVEEFHQRASDAAQTFAGDEYEIILVNDGSPDNSLDIAVRLCDQDKHLIVIDLSRNFGHHKAIVTGLSQSKGEYIYLLDSDLEEEPEQLNEFSERLFEDRCDVVYGVQETRKGGWFERSSGWFFYRIFNVLTGVNVPKNWVTMRLMSRRYVDALLLHSERELSIGGLYLLTGFEQRPINITKHSSSDSTYTLRKKISVLVAAITSLSSRPLVGIFYSGVFIFLMASAYTLFLAINWFFLGTPPSGWTSVMASVWLMGGLLISFIGIIGIYLSQVFLEAKQRPVTIVRKVYSNAKALKPDGIQ